MALFPLRLFLAGHRIQSQKRGRSGSYPLVPQREPMTGSCFPFFVSKLVHLSLSDQRRPLTRNYPSAYSPSRPEPLPLSRCTQPITTPYDPASLFLPRSNLSSMSLPSRTILLPVKRGTDQGQPLPHLCPRHPHRVTERISGQTSTH